jgi:ubiquinone/menaquinone biosynthesis C-methylase UbiE
MGTGVSGAVYREAHSRAPPVQGMRSDRLERQGAFFRDLTEDVWKRAGLRDGMRVLDLGCGVGDTSLLAARLVGRFGVAVGVDRSAKAIDVAQRRATTARPRNSVQFVVADLDTFVPDEPFDALVGRLVLLYLRDPAATLRRLSAYVRPRGCRLSRNGDAASSQQS